MEEKKNVLFRFFSSNGIRVYPTTAANLTFYKRILQYFLILY